MKERPILFSAPMVEAILGGRKTQTRRIIKTQPSGMLDKIDHCQFVPSGWGMWNSGSCTCREIKCPYGTVGDQLWVRENMYSDGDGWWFPAAGEFKFPEVDDDYTDDVYAWLNKQAAVGRRTVPSIHMPRWASRIDLQITDVRAEPLRKITNEDAQAEGTPENLTYIPVPSTQPENMINPPVAQDWRKGFERLWSLINGPDSWQENPWVWVVEFKALTR